MTWPYRACLIGALLVLVPLVWFVPWSWKIRHFSRGAGREEILLLLGYAVYALAYNRDAYRCRRCDGILW